MAMDNWSEALRKYEGALRVVPNDPQAEERVDMVRRVQQDADQITVNLNMVGGTLDEQVNQLTTLKQTLARARQALPNSQRLTQLQKDVDNKLNGVRTQLNDQALAALNRAEDAVSLDERLKLIDDSVKLMELSVELDPSDNTVSETLMEARAAHGEMSRAQQTN